jgi:hypothetical protein
MCTKNLKLITENSVKEYAVKIIRIIRVFNSFLMNMYFYQHEIKATYELLL